MPHIIVEYSPQLEDEIDVPHMLHDMHQSLGERLGGVERIKTRAVKIDHNVVGEQGIEGRMIHITLLLLEGRDVETKKAYSEPLCDIAKKCTNSFSSSCAVTLEVRDMDKDTYIL